MPIPGALGSSRSQFQATGTRFCQSSVSFDEFVVVDDDDVVVVVLLMMLFLGSMIITNRNFPSAIFPSKCCTTIRWEMVQPDYLSCKRSRIRSHLHSHMTKS